MKVGTYTGTGAAINVSLGFIPDYVRIINANDAGALDPSLDWIKGMGDGFGLKQLRIVDNATTANKSQAIVTTNGISAYAGDGTHAPGFTIGADTDLNTTGEIGYWIADRNAPGK
jgi:hypothetical protein